MDQEKQNVSDQYALVTGSGSGIGFAFAEALAKRKYNLVMVTLPGENLHDTAASLAKQYNVHVRAIETDLTRIENCINLHNDILAKGIRISVLINNAGIGSNAPFTNYETAFYEKQITLNTIVPVTLCRLFIPDMNKLKEAYILNMASMGAFFYMPYKEVYVATKSFLISFTRSLQFTLQGTPVSMTVLCPGSVNSNARLKQIHAQLRGVARKTVMEPHEVAEQGLDAMFRKEKLFVPGRVNRWLLRLNMIMPTAIKDAIIRKEMNRQESLKPPLP
ncbi:MAG TPA: SDR family NAD(P)-dependent oxidoreductase [Chitinophagaceae bacterium]|nr:SDR family NAD(P)-dependent oxidoreductase [Chitinophagaceae bacterium]